MHKIYQALLKERVSIPSEESVFQSLCPDYNAEVQNQRHSPSSTNLSSSVNQSQIYNKQQFASFQLPPNNFQDRPQSQALNANKFATNASQSVQQPQQNDKDYQQTLATNIRKDYKKLHEYESSAKMCDELLQSTNGQLDQDLLIQFRTQLQEGKDFTEKYLKMLMDSTFTIKDKEQKINKILGIINEIGTILEKILILCPYSPRSLAKLKEQRAEEEQKEQQALTKRENKPEPMGAKQQVSRPQSVHPLNSSMSQLNERAEQTPSSIQKKQKIRAKVGGEANKQSIQREDSSINDTQLNKDAFMTNFMGGSSKSSSSLAQKEWMNSSQKDFSNFKFPNQDEKQKEKQNPLNTSHSIPQFKEEFDFNETEALRLSHLKSNSPPKIAPQDMIPKRSQQVPPQEQQFEDKNDVKPAIKVPKMNSHKRKLSNGLNPFGVIIKSQNDKPSIQQLSPASDVSSENEDVFDDSTNEKHDFKFPKDYNTYSEAPRQSVMESYNNQSVVKQQQKEEVKKVESSAFDWFTSAITPSGASKEQASNEKNSARNTPVEKAIANKMNGQGSDQKGGLHKKEGEAREKKAELELERKIKSLAEQNEELINKNQELKSKVKQMKKQQEQSNLNDEQGFALERQEYQSKIDDLNQQIKGLKKFEFLYESERYSKIEIQNELSVANEQCQKLKTTIDRLNNKLSKREREVEKVSQDLHHYKEREEQLNQQVKVLDKELEVKDKVISELRNNRLKDEKQFRVVMKNSIIQKQNLPLRVLDSKREQQRQKEESKEVTPQILKQSSYQTNPNEIDLEEMFCDVPSSDSDKESEVQEKWDMAKTLYKEMDTPTPGEDYNSQRQPPGSINSHRNEQKTEIQQRAQFMDFDFPASQGNQNLNGNCGGRKKSEQEESNINEFWQFTTNRDEDEINNSFLLNKSQFQTHEQHSQPIGFSMSWGEEDPSTNQINPQKFPTANQQNKIELIPKQKPSTQSSKPVIPITQNQQTPVQGVFNKETSRPETPKTVIQGIMEIIQGQNQPQTQESLQAKQGEEKKESPFSFFSSFFTPKVQSPHVDEANHEKHHEEHQQVSSFEGQDAANIYMQTSQAHSKEQSNKLLDIEDLLGFKTDRLQVQTPTKRPSQTIIISSDHSSPEMESHIIKSEEKKDPNKDILHEGLQSVQVNLSNKIGEPKASLQNDFDWMSFPSQGTDENAKVNEAAALKSVVNEQKVNDFDSFFDQFEPVQQKVDTVQRGKSEEIKNDTSNHVAERKQSFDDLFSMSINQKEEVKQPVEVELKASPISPVKNLIDNDEPIIIEEVPYKNIEYSNEEQKIELLSHPTITPVFKEQKKIVEPIQHEKISPQNELNQQQNEPQKTPSQKEANEEKKTQIQLPQQAPPQMPLSRNSSIQSDISLNKSQFNTLNTQQFANQQQQEQSKLDPQAMLRMILLNFFRKGLLSNKAVLYEDQHIQIGSIAEYSEGNQVTVKLFFGNKNQQALPLEAISLKQMLQPIGYQAHQSKDLILKLSKEQQDLVEIKIQAQQFSLSIPVYSLSYKVSSTPVSNIPIRLPILLLKFCKAMPNLNPTMFKDKWATEYGPETEGKQSFNVDFNQCRSLTQLKEVLMVGRQAFSFAEGVEQQKNIVCGGTQFVLNSQIFGALLKVTITGNGQNCEIVGRSSDRGGQEQGKFAKFVISNVLELIALKIN